MVGLGGSKIRFAEFTRAKNYHYEFGKTAPHAGYEGRRAPFLGQASPIMSSIIKISIKYVPSNFSHFTENPKNSRWNLPTKIAMLT